MKRRGRYWWWLIFCLGLFYFFMPLLATFWFSLKPKVPFKAYVDAFNDQQFWSTLGYSFGIGLITTVVSVALIVPTAYWVRIRVRRLRPAVEFVTLMPFVIPAVILVFGLIRLYAGPVPLLSTRLGSDVVLVGAYSMLALPYMYRAVDTGLRAIDIKSLTEAAQSLGAGWPTVIIRVILPNVRVAILSGAFLTLAIVMGEFTIASFLVRPAFGPYLNQLGDHFSFQAAAISLLSFGLTWMAMGMITYFGRGARSRVPVVGGR